MSEVSSNNENNSDIVKKIMSEMPADKKKSLKGWYFFDWANQAYALTVTVSYTHLTLPTKA